MFRSEEMAFCEMLLPYDSAYDIITELGEMGQTQFLDFNEDASPLNRKFGSHFKQCCDLERNLGELALSISKDDIKISKVEGNPPVLDVVAIDDLKATVSELMAKLNESARNIENLKEQQRNLIYMINAISLTQPYTLTEILGTEDYAAMNQDTVTSIGQLSLSTSRTNTANEGMMAKPVSGRQRTRSSTLSPAQAARVSALLDCITGVVDRKTSKSFEKMLFRIGRGNIFVRTMPIDDAAYEEILDKTNDRKSVFIAYFNSQALKEKVTQICHAFHANIYNEISDKSEQRVEASQTFHLRLEDIKSVLNQAVDQRQMLLTAAAQQVKTWLVQVRKAKAVCSVMGMLNWDVTRNYLVAECWCAVAQLPEVELAVKRANARCHQRNKRARANDDDDTDNAAPVIVERKALPKGRKMPTYFKGNKVTKAYQNIVNAYAIPLPGEVNPSLFTVITFPFLFSVMFGDFGHAVILTIFALWMIIKEEKLKTMAEHNESFRMIFGGRYVVLLMGLFSMYAGVIYNDAFCKSFRIFNPKWHSNHTIEELRKREVIAFDPVLGRDRFDLWPYEVGLDPIWDVATNRLMQQNSVKMKLSVIFGVFHMLFGICLSLINHIHFKSYTDIYCNFVPQILFIVCLFVYMDAIIVFKWVYFDATKNDQAFSVLIGMINMVLFKYTDENPADKFISENLMKLQYALVVVALISIPWMLLMKPLILRRRHQIEVAQKKNIVVNAAEIVENKNTPPTSPSPRESGIAASTDTAKLQQQQQQSGEPASAVELHQVTVVTTAEAEAERNVDQRRVSLAASSIHPASSTTVDESSSICDESDDGHQAKKKGGDEEDEEEFQFSEVFIHQAIHTIEYVLGLISHTASYLRLWALNLAHSELATVLWHMVFRLAFNNAHDGYTGVIAIVIIFIPWSVLTIGILVIMEGVSAFLHALRLHWVEFQSKFYIGGGELFQPLTFRTAFITKD